MTTGYLAAGACWPTANEAIDAYYSSIPQMPSSNAGFTFKSYYTKSNGVWKFNVTHVSNTTTNVVDHESNAPTNVYGSCTLPETGTGTGTGGTTTGTVSIVYPPVTYDYAAATAAWTFAVTIVVGTWMIAKNAGAIINAIKFW